MSAVGLQLSTEVVSGFCNQHHVRRLSLFGSQLRDEARVDSDIDLLIEFEPGREPGLIGLAQMEAELSQLLGGQRVDLRTPGDLSRYFRDDVISKARVQYARG